MGFKRKSRLILCLICLLIFAVISIFTIVIFDFSLLASTAQSEFLYQIGKLFGLLGFLFLSILIISGDTARYFDKYWGIDKIIKFQRIFSYFTFLFILGHPIFFMLAHKTFWYYFLPNTLFIPMSLGIISFYIFVLVMLASKFYKLISYKLWQGIHLITYILFIFSLYHALFWGSDSQSNIIRAIYFIIFICVLCGAIYRLNYKFFKETFIGKITNIKTENHDTFTVEIKLNRAMKFEAGQFCFLRLDKDRLYARHPFSISSSNEDNTKLSFTIKDAGRFTKTIRNSGVGEQLFVDGPFGIFTIKSHMPELVFIAGGVGITPFMSMINRELYKSGSHTKTTLFYSVKNEKDLLFKNELEKINAAWFDKFYILSRENLKNKNENYKYGRLNVDLIKKHVINNRAAYYYICGPESMKKDLIKKLTAFGISKQQIFYEDFFW